MPIVAEAGLRPVGVLMLETAFARYPGDIGDARSWRRPVLFEVVKGATPHRITRLSDNEFLRPFVSAGERVAARGAAMITTSCGFLALYQEELARRLPVPVATSALLQIPLLARGLPAGRRVGVLTFSAESLTGRHLAAVGAPEDIAIEGLEAGGIFRRAILGEAVADSYAAREREAVAAAKRLVAGHPEIGGIVLECTNLVPHAAEIQAATGRPVHDIMTLIDWLMAGVEARAWPRP